MLGKDGFVVLAINESEEPDHVFAYTGQLSVDPTFPILFDRDSTVAQLYGIKGLAHHRPDQQTGQGCLSRCRWA
ncbi:hypothetical protein MNBD_GAMMA13-261 [hydrothermal vent metagenome]|uniref:Alkyl hydroperoxide reductase subunit C/ Thiol specific antioxidant domain-containing protein n=1 Tax=hydrothermal vent metagenome TaxID=652676 RepID=A0A3B0Y934_9ZZZZ